MEQKALAEGPTALVVHADFIDLDRARDGVGFALTTTEEKQGQREADEARKDLHAHRDYRQAPAKSKVSLFLERSCDNLRA